MFSGTITLTNSGGNGISDFGDNNTTTITGTINAGANSNAVDSSGSNNTTYINGTIQSEIGALYNSGTNSFTLQEGAIIIGPIKSVSLEPTLNIDVGLDTSYIYTTEGTWTVNDLDGRSFSYSNNVASSLSAGNSETADEMLFTRNRSLQMSLQRRANTDQGPWVDVYKHSSQRAANTAQPAMLTYKENSNGISLGLPVLSGARPLDIVINSHRTALNIGQDSQTIDSQSTKLGIMVRQASPVNGWQLTASGFVGRTSYDGQRGKILDNLSATGMTSLSAEYSSTEAILAVTAGYTTNLSKTLRFKGSFEGSYAYENFAAYSEGSNFSWAARKLGQTSGGISAGPLYQPQKNLSYHLRVGTQRRTVVKGAQASYTANGTSYSVGSGLKSENYYDTEVGFDYLGSNGMSLTGSINGFNSEYKINGATAYLSLNWDF
ncbi:hypothetical protein ACMAY8_14645 [Rhodobacteraceae bacterium nBUS_22]